MNERQDPIERERARVMVIEAAAMNEHPSGRLRIREMDRISALTGVDGESIRHDARQAGAL
ncbi:MAG: hypothetical protein JXA07_04035 [Spirochaetes bacterium]|nr:hypothetical protein [Spirochaetota bacterium]